MGGPTMSPRQNEKIFRPWSRPTPAQIGLVLEGISRRWRRFAQGAAVHAPKRTSDETRVCTLTNVTFEEELLRGLCAEQRQRTGAASDALTRTSDRLDRPPRAGTALQVQEINELGAIGDRF